MKKLIIIIFALIFYSSSCEDPCCVDTVYSIWLKDNSGEGFVFLVSYNYPDTTIPDKYNKLTGVPPNKMVPYDSDKKWEKVFEDLPADTLSIFIFDGDTLQFYDWETVRNDYKILKRYDISLQDLEKMNWVITYP